MLFTTNQYGELLTENILDPNGEIIASARYDGTEVEAFYFYNYDPHGNTSTILNPSGTMKIAYVYDAFGNEERSGSPSFLNEVMMTKSIKDKSTKKVVNDADGTTYDTLLNKPLSYYALPDEDRKKKKLKKPTTHSCKTSNCGRCATEQDVARNLADTKEAKENEAKRAEEKRKAEIEYWKAYEQQQKEYWGKNKPVLGLKTIVFYYNNPSSGFEEQAMNSHYFDSKNKDVKMIGVLQIDDFILAWNDLDYANIDNIYLYLHGGEGVLYFKGETMNMTGEKSFGQLNNINVQGSVYLFSCKGGKGEEGNNVAWKFSSITGTSVRATASSVSFSKGSIWFGNYEARVAKNDFFDLEHWWGDFYYEDGNAQKTTYYRKWAS